MKNNTFDIKRDVEILFDETDATSKISSKNIKDLKNKYKNTYKELFNKLPEWRKKEVLTCYTSKDYDNRFYTEFVQEVIELSEQSPITPIKSQKNESSNDNDEECDCGSCNCGNF